MLTLFFIHSIIIIIRYSIKLITDDTKDFCTFAKWKEKFWILNVKH